MIRCSLLSLVLLSAFAGRAQTVNVRLLKDDPVNVKGFRLLFDPLYFTTWKPNGNAGMGLGLLINGGKLFTYEMDVRFAYGDKYHVKGDNSIPKFFNMDMYFSWHFGKQTTPQNYKVKVADHGSSYSYVNVGMRKRVAFGYRTGISVLGTGMSWESTRSFYISGADTNYLSGTGKSTALTAIAGMSVKFVHCALVSLDGFKKAEGGCHEFFLDAMPLLSLDNGYVRPAYDTISYEVHVERRQKLGMRFGWRFYDPSRSNLAMGFHIGNYAGPHYGKQYNFFLFHFGFCFGEKLKE